MAGSLNKVMLIGNLGADPEVRRMNSGEPVVTLSVATSENWRDKNSGERRERTEWHRVVIFNENLCKVAESYLKKGSKVYLEGQLQTRKWQAQDGSDRWSTEVVLQRFRGEIQMLDKAEGRPGPDPDSYGTTRSRPAPDSERSDAYENNKSSRGLADEMDDEIPF